MLDTIPDYFYDFYTLSIFFDRENFEDVELALEVLQNAQINLIEDILYGIQCEASHIHGHGGLNAMIESTKGMMRLRKRFNIIQYEGDYSSPSNVAKYVHYCRAAFNYRHWSFCYGGPAWKSICDRWLKVNNLFIERSNLSESFALIDQLIDAAHNTGRCLDKKYSNINQWLNRKTHEKDMYWLVNRSSFAPYAKKRIKATFNICEFARA